MMDQQGISRSSFLSQARAFLVGLLVAPAMAAAAEKKMDKKAAAPAATAIRSAIPVSSTDLFVQDFNAFDGKTQEQELKEMRDREELRELLARYAHQTARGMDCSDLYTDDGAFIVVTPGRPTTETRGRASLSKVYSTMADMPQPPKPQIHNSLLEIHGDEARGICSNEVRVVENGKSVIGSGYYEDTFRRVNGRWRFVVRKATFYHWVPMDQGWAKSTSPI
jgi:hypothetical protein